MVSNKLKNLFLLTLVPIYLHGFEELITGFPQRDSFMIAGGNYFNISSVQFYWISHAIFWLLLPLVYILFHMRQIALLLFSLFGIFFIIEMHHIIKAYNLKGYYPGLLTAIIYPFIGIFYWKELVINWRNYGRR